MYRYASFMSQLTLKNGRNLEYFSNGIQEHRAILYLHGTPGEGGTWRHWLDETPTLAIATSRAGYGNSDRNKGRSVADDLADQSEILDHFGVTQFVAIGWSGGGPHALNMTRNPRCVAAFTIAGVAEWGNDDLDFLEGMGPENHDEFGAALKGESAITEWMERNGPGLRNVKGDDLIAAFGGLIGEADKKALTPEVAEESAESMRKALAKSFDGWIDDDLAFVRDFGFKLESIDKPVTIWQGDDDFMVPKPHSEWLAKKIPNSKLNFVPGHGHISLGESYRTNIIKEALSYLRISPLI